MKIRFLVTALLTLACVAPPTLAAGDGADDFPIAASALGGDGQLYQLVAGSFGDLFPEDGTQPSDNPVLALEVVEPDGTRERSVVPGSEGPDLEGAPSVVFEDAPGRLFAVWESKKKPTVSRLLLASFGADGWSEPLEISGDVSPLKGEPQVLISRDQFTSWSSEGTSESRSRTAIHVTWREQTPTGSALFYTPVILESGRYIGWNPVIPLDELAPEESASKASTEAVSLLRTPTITAGQDLHSAIIAYLGPSTGRLMTVEVRLLAGELGAVADDVRADVVGTGVGGREDVQALADDIRADIIEIGHDLNPELIRSLAKHSARSLVEIYDADPDLPVHALGDRIRADIIEIGARLLDGPRDTRRVKMQLELEPEAAAEADGPEAPRVTHLVRLRIVESRPAPPLGGVPAHILASEDGERVLVGWIAEGKVFYTESPWEADPEDEVWSPIRHLTLTERLGPLEAAAILEARVKRRR